MAGLHTDFTDPLALHAIKMIQNDLVKSYEGDMDARDRMHYAQCLAGMSFSNALLGIAHSMAHKTGAVFGIAHGLANAIYLPYVIEFNAKVAESRYAAIARHIGLAGSNDKELVASLVAWCRSMNKALNLPLSLKEYGIDEKDFLDKVQMIAERAIADACTGSNPRPISAEEMKEVFLCAYYGKDITF